MKFITNSWEWLINRLQEPTTYHGIGLLFGLYEWHFNHMSPLDAFTYSTMISGIVLIIAKDQKNKKSLTDTISDAIDSDEASKIKDLKTKD